MITNLEAEIPIPQNSLEVELETSKLMKSPVIWVKAKESSVPNSNHGGGS